MKKHIYRAMNVKKINWDKAIKKKLEVLVENDPELNLIRSRCWQINNSDVIE